MGKASDEASENMAKTEKDADCFSETPLLQAGNTPLVVAVPNFVNEDSGLPNVHPLGPKKVFLESRQDSIEIPACSLVPVPPDGGWGWVVVAASFIINMIVDGMTYSFGILLPEFLSSLGGTVEIGALIGSLMVGFYLLVGPIVGGLVNRFGARPVVFVGSVVTTVAFFVSYWADSLIWLMITFGVTGGIGCGLMVLPGIVYVSYYFETKRALATGIAVAGSGFGAFVFPPLTSALIDAYTWRGALWIFAGITLNCAIFGCLMRPLPTPKIVREMKKQISLSRSNMQASDWTLNFNKDGVGGMVGLNRRKKTSRAESQASSSGFPSPRALASARHRQLDAVLAAAGVDADSGVDRISRVSSSLAMQPPALDAVKEEPLAEQREDVTRQSKGPAQNGNLHTEVEVDGRIIRSSDADEKKRENGEPDTETERPSLHRSNSSDSSLGGDSPIHFKIEGPSRRPEHFQQMHRNDDRSAAATPPTVNTAADSMSQLGASTTEMRPSISRMISRTSRVSVRDFASSLNRFTSTNALGTSTNVSQTNLAAIVDPSEFSKPFARQDIFLSGSIRNLNAFKRSGSNLRSYRESIVSIPRGIDFYDVVKAGALPAVPEPPPPESAICSWVPFTVRSVLSQMLDRELLQHPTMQLLCLSNFCGFLAFYVPFVYLASYATKLGIPTAQASLLLSLIGMTNTVGRVLCGWAADKGWVKAIHVNNISLLACGFLTVFVPLYTTRMWLNLYSAFFGFFMAAFVCLTSIILVDHLGLQRLTNAFGLLILVRGFACLIGSPLAGYIYTRTASYDASFIFSGVLIVLAGLISCLIPWVEKSKFALRKAEQLAGVELDDNTEQPEDGAGVGGVAERSRRQLLAAGPDRRLEDIVEALAEYELSLSSKAGAKLLQNGQKFI